MRYIKRDGIEIERTVIPCSIKYDVGYIYLIAFRVGLDEKYPAYYRLDRIYSFLVERGQFKNEQQIAKEYLQKYSKGITQMFGGDFKEVVICCKREYYPYVHDKFKNAKVIDEHLDDIYIRLWIFEEGFIKWIISQPTEMIAVKEPDGLRTKIASEANKIVRMYTEVQINGKKD
jgi:predicted DNA-binding transcriptional regulator YafY